MLFAACFYGLFKLGSFFFDLCHHWSGVAFRPVKADLCGSFLYPVCAKQRWHSARDAGHHRVVLFAAALAFLYFYLLPVSEHFVGVFDADVAKYMRMAAYHLCGYRVKHVADGEIAALFSKAGDEYYLKQEVSAFFAHIIRVFVFDGLYQLIGLFYDIAAQRKICLFAVPWTAVRSAQPFHNAYEFRKFLPQLLIGGGDFFIH